MKKISAYQCEYCDKIYFDEDVCDRHVKECWMSKNIIKNSWQVFADKLIGGVEILYVLDITRHYIRYIDILPTIINNPEPMAIQTDKVAYVERTPTEVMQIYANYDISRNVKNYENVTNVVKDAYKECEFEYDEKELKLFIDMAKVMVEYYKGEIL